MEQLGTDYVDGGGGVDEVAYNLEHLFFSSLNASIFYETGSPYESFGPGAPQYQYAATGIRANLVKGEIRDTTGIDVDYVVNIENVRGSIFDDDIRGNGKANQLRGDDGDDFLLGRNGNDKLLGENGQDILFGGKGNDVLSGGNDSPRGGKGNDVFVFEAKGDYDRVRDFQDGRDLLDVSAYGFSSAADLISAALQNGNKVVIELSDSDAIILQNFVLTNLDADDFIL